MKKEILILVVMAGGLAAQRVTDTRTPTMRGGGNEGKCTIEVEVDDSAEVEISNNRAQIRTMSGAPAKFRRFECNQEIPANPLEFRFKGIDGRGRQELVRMPGGRGPAVVRIDDPKGGSHGYTFDIFWRGAGGPWNGGDGNRDEGFGNRRGGFGNSRNNDSRNSNGNWNRQLNFNGGGSGSLRTERGGEERLSNCRVRISRQGQVEVSFDGDRSQRIELTGQVRQTDGDRIIANMRGQDGNGEMEIETDGRNRVRSVSMRSRGGRDRFELEWRD